jgi:hypothetical protein
MGFIPYAALRTKSGSPGANDRACRIRLLRADIVRTREMAGTLRCDFREQWFALARDIERYVVVLEDSRFGGCATNHNRSAQ